MRATLTMSDIDAVDFASRFFHGQDRLACARPTPIPPVAKPRPQHHGRPHSRSVDIPGRRGSRRSSRRSSSSIRKRTQAPVRDRHLPAMLRNVPGDTRQA
jgi:hypothetical protein